MSEYDRTRWHCRRGMLELDLVLNAFLERHFPGLDAAGRDAFGRLLDLSDPELLDLVMGREEAVGRDDREILALVRSAQCNDRIIPTVSS
jgi:antitoxin CptB